MSKEQEKNYVKGAKTIEAKKVLEKVTVKSGENKKDYTKKANKTDANFVSFLLFYKDICYFGVKKCLFFLGLGFHYIKNYIYNLFLKITGKKSKKATANDDRTKNTDFTESTKDTKKERLRKIKNVLVFKFKETYRKISILLNTKLKILFCYLRETLHEVGFLGLCKQHKNVLMAVSLVVIFLVMMIVSLSVHESNLKNYKSTYSNLLRINTVQSQVNNLEVQLSSTSQLNAHEKDLIEFKLKGIDDKLDQLSSRSDNNTQSKIQALKNTIQSEHITLYQKVNALNHALIKLKKKLSPTPTLGSSALPFIVQDIDTWNGKPFAEITQKGNETMVSYLGLYQHSGNWKVIDINAPEQFVTLVNRAGQVVHIQIQAF